MCYSGRWAWTIRDSGTERRGTRMHLRAGSPIHPQSQYVDAEPANARCAAVANAMEVRSLHECWPVEHDWSGLRGLSDPCGYLRPAHCAHSCARCAQWLSARGAASAIQTNHMVPNRICIGFFKASQFAKPLQDAVRIMSALQDIGRLVLFEHGHFHLTAPAMQHLHIKDAPHRQPLLGTCQIPYGICGSRAAGGGCARDHRGCGSATGRFPP
jgi:hypothetical protein